MVVTIIRQADITKDQLLKSCPAYAEDAALNRKANKLRAVVISVMSEMVVFQIYCGGAMLVERVGRTPNDERTGVAIFDKFMAGELI